MNKLLILCCLLCVTFSVKAHQPGLSSTILVEEDGHSWILQVRASLTAFEYVIEDHYGKSAFATPEEFRQLVISYLKKHILIQYNETDSVILKNGLVQLGHETSVAFNVLGTPERMETLKIRNTAFSDLSRNKSALIMLKKGLEKEQFILDNNNGHSVDLMVVSNRFELVTPAQNKFPKMAYIILVFGLFVLGLFFLFRKKSEPYREKA